MVASTEVVTQMHPDSKNDENHLIEKIRALGPGFAARAAEHDAEDQFVSENYAELADAGFFSAQVPTELGGAGVPLSGIAAALRELAHHCPSTALATSMHQHLIATLSWRFRKDGAGEKVLRKVAETEAVLISTGASDWLDSSGEATKVEGGYRVKARKIFASGSPAGSFLITSARYEDPTEGMQALHFPVAFGTEGVRLEETWCAHGMRSTGSHDVIYDDVFVPEESVVLRRKAGPWHPFFDVVVGVALPIIVSVYTGIAEAAADEAAKRCDRRRHDGTTQLLLGEMTNELATAQLAADSMIVLAEEGHFQPDLERTNAILVRKTIAANAAIRTVEKAVEAVGGAAYFRSSPLEKLQRDVRAAHFHPLPEKRQQQFSGRMALGLDPIKG